MASRLRIFAGVVINQNLQTHRPKGGVLQFSKGVREMAKKKLFTPENRSGRGLIERLKRGSEQSDSHYPSDHGESQLEAFCTSGDSPGKEGSDDR